MALLLSATRASLNMLRAPTSALSPIASSSMLRTFTTTLPTQLSPRKKHLAQRGSGGKLKTHSGTKKRFIPLGSGSGKAYQVTFKRSQSNKQHLNSGMSSGRLNNLGQARYSPSGKVGRMLRRLLGPSL